ncbi:MAG TPA: alkaline phosphatase family protein [Mucilaginibacter sp.]|jgi:phospholipase C|nr:alkaline phosphatase family protein [Mucilaginibacter sp.]
MKNNYLSKSNPLTVAVAGLLLLSLSFAGCKKNNTSATDGINKVNHVVVIYMENHSFDNLYGQFAGANGLQNATAANTTQVNGTGTAYTFLPAVPNTPAIPTNLPNTYFNIDQYVANDVLTPDVTHRYYQEPLQIDGGKMDKYAFYNIPGSSAGLSQGFYKTSLLPMLPFAQKYVLCDNFFHSAFGGSFLNHQWLIAAASPTFPNAPASIVANPALDASGNIVSDNFVTPDGFAVNTCYSVNTPHPAGTAPEKLVPNQTNPTIGDRLSDKNISWAWYSGGWNNAMAGTPDATFQFHHQPFIYYKNFADGTQAKKDHLKDETDFIAAAKAGTLPAVSFVKPLGLYNEHPGYSDVALGENHAVDLINAVLNGPNGKDAVIIVTYDENGGFWDHVAPPVIDTKWGPGTRVPAIIVSPFAKQGFVDHTQYETVSILSFIEKRWNLSPLASRDKNANPLQNAFNF